MIDGQHHVADAESLKRRHDDGVQDDLAVADGVVEAELLELISKPHFRCPRANGEEDDRLRAPVALDVRPTTIPVGIASQDCADANLSGTPLGNDDPRVRTNQLNVLVHARNLELSFHMPPHHSSTQSGDCQIQKNMVPYQALLWFGILPSLKLKMTKARELGAHGREMDFFAVASTSSDTFGTPDMTPGT